MPCHRKCFNVGSNYKTKKNDKLKKLIILLFILISNNTFGQDWCAWEFKFKFKLNTEETIRYKYKNVEVFFNDSYTYEMLRDSELKYDSITKEYLLLLNYGCISCGFPNEDFPPEIYLKVEMEYPHFGYPFSTIIPIYFQKSESFADLNRIILLKTSDTINTESIGAINLGTIEIKHFLTDNHWKDNIETYEIIEVNSTDSIHYKKEGQYTPRRMNR